MELVSHMDLAAVDLTSGALQLVPVAPLPVPVTTVAAVEHLLHL